MRSALHPQLGARLRGARLAERGHACATPALAPGLAAELTPVLGRLPLDPEANAVGNHVAWCGALVVPPVPDPQNPECLYQLLNVLDVELPALVGAMVDRPLRRLHPGHVMVWLFREGGFADEVAPLAPDGVDVFLGLTGGRWPAAFGGHLDVRDVGSFEPGFDALHLTRGWRVTVPLVTRPVEALWVRAGLVPT